MNKTEQSERNTTMYPFHKRASAITKIVWYTQMATNLVVNYSIDVLIWIDYSSAIEEKKIGFSVASLLTTANRILNESVFQSEMFATVKNSQILNT